MFIVILEHTLYTYKKKFVLIPYAAMQTAASYLSCLPRHSLDCIIRSCARFNPELFGTVTCCRGL